MKEKKDLESKKDNIVTISPDFKKKSNVLIGLKVAKGWYVIIGNKINR